MKQMTDVHIQDLAFDTGAAAAGLPFLVQVHRLSATLADQWLEKMVQVGLDKLAGQLPLEITHESSQFVGNGAEVTVKVKKGFFSTSATVCLEVAGAGPNRILARVAAIRILGTLPVEGLLSPLVEMALDRAVQSPGIVRHPTDPRAVLLDPNRVLQTHGVPLQFADSAVWSVLGQPEGLVLKVGQAQV